MRGFLVTSICVLTVAGALLAGCGGGGGESNEVILGAILPLNGPNAQTGREMLNSVKLAVKEWNESGKLGRWTCRVVEMDDGGEQKEAVNAVHDMYNNYPLSLGGVVAHLNSGCFYPASPIYHDYRVPAMSPATTNPKITQQGFDNIFRVCTTDIVQGGSAVILFETLGIKSVALIHDRTQYGQGLTDVIKAGCTGKGITVTSEDGIPVADKDFKSVLTKIRASNPEAIYFGGMYDEGGLLVRQMRDLGMQQPFFGGDGLKGSAFTDAGGEATIGSRVSIVGAPMEEMGGGVAAAFFANYEREFGQNVENYGPFAYDVANILLTAIGQVLDEKDAVDREAIIKKIRTIEHDGVIGHTSFDEFGDTTNKIITFYEVYLNDMGDLDFKPYEVIRPQ